MPNVSKKILLVEDDISLMEMYSLKFNEQGYQILQAHDGVEALEVAIKQQPDIILLDIMMPKMDGFATLTEIRKTEKIKHTPVVLLSNLGQKDDIEKGKKLGATDYIVKASLTPAELFSKALSYLK
jgi:DNA-binding response OmpR family regulator